MDLLPLCVMVSFIIGMALVLSNDADVNTICQESSSLSTVIPLTCESSKRIHVISKRYGNTTLDQCGQNKPNIFATSLNSSEDGLIVNCNGEQNTTCQEASLASSCKPVCAIEIKHECVEDSMSVCSAVNAKKDNGIVYLHSPGFPDLDKKDNNCSCRITGTFMTVTVLEYHPGNGAVSIFADNKNVLQSAFTLYNTVIATIVSTVEVNYENKNKSVSMWIKVLGKGPLNIECMEVSNITSNKITTSTQATTKDLTFNSESTSSDPDGMYSVVTGDAVTSSTSNDRTEQVTTDAVCGSSDEVTPSTSNGRTEKEMTEAVSSTSDAATHTTSPTTTSSTSTIPKQGLPQQYVIPVSGAAGGLLLVVLIIVTVVCCRRRTNSCQHTEEKDNGRKNPASPKMQQMHSFQNNVFIGNNQADRVHIKLDVVIEPSRSVVVQNESTKVKRKSTDQYAKVVSKALKFSLHNKDEATNGNTCHMVDTDIYVGGPMINKTPQEGMVDNHLSCSMKYSIAETETKAPENIDDLGDQEIAMVVNDLYHSYQATADLINGNCVSNEPPQPAEILNIDDQENDKEEGMIINDLYHSYQSTADQSNGNSVSNGPPPAAETLNIDDQEYEKEEGMIINDLYHSYQSTADQSHGNSVSNGPPPAAETLNIDDQENEKEEGMFINDRYHSYQSPADQSNGNSVSNEPPKAPEILNIDDQENDKEEGMIINDLYHSYQATPGCGTYNG